jgi:hypothetical protein
VANLFLGRSRPALKLDQFSSAERDATYYLRLTNFPHIATNRTALALLIRACAQFYQQVGWCLGLMLANVFHWCVYALSLTLSSPSPSPSPVTPVVCGRDSAFTSHPSLVCVCVCV